MIKKYICEKLIYVPIYYNNILKMIQIITTLDEILSLILNIN